MARKQIWLVLAAVAAITAAAVTGMALAKSTRTTLRTASNAKLGETVVTDSGGRTVYELAPETTHHLLCTSSMCFKFWPPVTVRSAHAKLTKAAGINGKLGIMHRSGFFQVTLSGRPLYRFAGDSAAGQANGQGIKSFGGTWHVVAATSHSSSPGSTTTGSATPTTTMPSTTTTPPTMVPYP
jgi:predicted lipoprotein with Yx(FWY)xxD motif